MKYRKASKILCPKCKRPVLRWMDRVLLALFARKQGLGFSVHCRRCKTRVNVTRHVDGSLVDHF